MKKIIDSMPRWGFIIVVLVAILYLTLVPKPLPDVHVRLFPHADKVVHGIMFGGLMFVITLDWIRSHGQSGWNCRRIVIAAVSVIVFGGAIELLQDYMNMGRGGDWLDFLADAAGTLLAAAVSPRVVGWLMKSDVR